MKEWKQGDDAWTAWVMDGELNTSRSVFVRRNMRTNRLILSLPGTEGTTEVIDDLVFDTERGAIENLISRSRRDIEKLIKQKQEIDELISMYQKDIEVAFKALIEVALKALEEHS